MNTIAKGCMSERYLTTKNGLCFLGNEGRVLKVAISLEYL
jgi:hypothetical protein